jgi:hypothetical protein
MDTNRIGITKNIRVTLRIISGMVIKWFLIIFVIIVVFFSTLAIAFQMNWWESLLWRGDLVSLAGQLIIDLLDALTQK